MKSLEILGFYFVLGCRSLLAYRAQVIFLILHWVLSLFINTFFWWIIFSHLPQRLGDWEFYDLCLMSSLCYISWGIFTLFWGVHLIPDKFISGDIDKFLCRPISPLVGLIGEGLYPDALYEICSGLLLTGIFLYQTARPWSEIHLFKATVALVLGTIGIVLFHSIISMMTIWFGRIQNVQTFLHHLDELQKYPTEFFPKSLVMVLKFSLPLYFPGTFAARLLLGKSTAQFDWLILGFVLLSLLLIFRFLYSACLRNYVGSN